MHRNGLTLFKRPYNNWTTNWPEFGHSTPPADPARYQADEGVAMTMQFGNALYTVDDAALLAEYANAWRQPRAPLPAERGRRHGFESNCSSHRPANIPMPSTPSLATSVAVERSGPYSVMAEARALANGNPVNIGYLRPPA